MTASAPGLSPQPAAGAVGASRLWFWLTALAVLILDQASKGWVVRSLEPYRPFPVIGDFVCLTYVRNPGAAFSLLAVPAAAAWRLYFLISVAVVTIVILGIMVYRERQAGIDFLLALGLVCGGAAGNLVDRVRSGTVVDFIEVGVKAYHWPVFNVADSSVFIGVCWIIWQSLRKSRLPGGN